MPHVLGVLTAVGMEERGNAKNTGLLGASKHLDLLCTSLFPSGKEPCPSGVNGHQGDGELYNRPYHAPEADAASGHLTSAASTRQTTG